MQNYNDNFELETRNAAIQEPLLGVHHNPHKLTPTSYSHSKNTKCSGTCVMTRNFASIEDLSPWITEVDPRNPRTHGWRRKFSDRDVALTLIQLLSGSVLIFNVAVTAYVLRKTGVHGNIADIIGPESNGICSKIRLWNRWLHFAINALSTLLLGASNYCAQLLVAPKRSEVDAAHRNRKWLDVGIQSFRNLKSINRRRQAMWFILMLSSSTLHLFWNSAVFVENPFSTYSYGWVTADFLDDHQPWGMVAGDLSSIPGNISQINRLSNSECISRYGGRVTGLSSLLLVSSNVTMAQSISSDAQSRGSSLLYNDTTTHDGTDWSLNSEWMCTAWSSYGKRSRVSCTKQLLLPRVDDWTLVNFRDGEVADL